VRILTPSGYQEPQSLKAGELVCAFDANGVAIQNTINLIERVTPSSYDYEDYHFEEVDGTPGFRAGRGWIWYLINGKYPLFQDQSIWRNGQDVCHVSDLIAGDMLYDDADNLFTVDTVVKLDNALAPQKWTRFEISGDHSYIVDGIAVHNASRYWTTGNGTWSSSATANWSASSGGTGGASAPTSADDVNFDTLSSSGNYTVTHTGAKSVRSVTIGNPLTGAVTFASSGATTVYGSFINNTTAGVFNWTGLTTFAATTTGWTIGSFNGSSVTFNGTGGGWTVGGLTCAASTAVLTLTNGTPTGMTVTLQTNSLAPIVGNWNGSSAFANLTYQPFTFGNLAMTFAQGFTVTGTMAVYSSSGNPMNLATLVQFASPTLGTAISISVGTFNCAYGAIFRDVNLTVTGGSYAYIGDAGGNTFTGMSATTPITAYMVGTGNHNFYLEATNYWFTASGGSTASSRAPVLPQDSAIIDANSGTGTITQNIPRLGNLNCTGFTGTLTTSTVCEFYGSIILGTGMTLTASTQAYTYRGRGSSTFTCNGKSWSKAIAVDCKTGTLTLGSNFVSSASISLTRGTINDGGYNITPGSFTFNYGATFYKSGNLMLQSVAGTVTLSCVTYDSAGAIYLSTACTLDTSNTSNLYPLFSIILSAGTTTFAWNVFVISLYAPMNTTINISTQLYVTNWNVNGAPTDYTDPLNPITQYSQITGVGAQRPIYDRLGNPVTFYSNWVGVTNINAGGSGGMLIVDQNSIISTGCASVYKRWISTLTLTSAHAASSVLRSSNYKKILTRTVNSALTLGYFMSSHRQALTAVANAAPVLFEHALHRAARAVNVVTSAVSTRLRLVGLRLTSSPAFKLIKQVARKITATETTSVLHVLQIRTLLLKNVQAFQNIGFKIAKTLKQSVTSSLYIPRKIGARSIAYAHEYVSFIKRADIKLSVLIVSAMFTAFALKLTLKYHVTSILTHRHFIKKALTAVATKLTTISPIKGHLLQFHITVTSVPRLYKGLKHSFLTFVTVHASYTPRFFIKSTANSVASVKRSFFIKLKILRTVPTLIRVNVRIWVLNFVLTLKDAARYNATISNASKYGLKLFDNAVKKLK
jgi:hypothetical protein